jgi:hypothetical protein
LHYSDRSLGGASRHRSSSGLNAARGSRVVCQPASRNSWAISSPTTAKRREWAALWRIQTCWGLECICTSSLGRGASSSGKIASEPGPVKGRCFDGDAARPARPSGSEVRERSDRARGRAASRSPGRRDAGEASAGPQRSGGQGRGATAARGRAGEPRRLERLASPGRCFDGDAARPARPSGSEVRERSDRARGRAASRSPGQAKKGGRPVGRP